MAALKGLEWTFDTVASAYEKFRPGYVDALYQTIFDYLPVDGHSHVLEVGSGAGQATQPVLKTGCRLLAVEYGQQFSGLLREKFGAYPGFSVMTGRFEDAVLEADAYDLIFSASAFHWIPEKVGYEKVFSLLKSGGAFARFANHPYPAAQNTVLAEEIDAIYDVYYNKFHGKEKRIRRQYTEQEAKETAMIAKKYGFSDIRYALFYRERIFSAKEYVALLGTYSDHIAIDEPTRKEFFSMIEAAINHHGGTMILRDTMDLQLARKP